MNGDIQQQQKKHRRTVRFDHLRLTFDENPTIVRFFYFSLFLNLFRIDFFN